jgi:hypothetical protein
MKPRDLLGFVLIFAVLGLGGGGFYAAQRFGRPGMDRETLCPATGAIAATIILIDKSDPLTPAQADAVRSEILEARDALKIGEKIKIAVLERDAASGLAAIRVWRGVCNPGLEANPLYQNPKLVRARYEDAFRAPLDRELDALTAPGTAPQSSIVEALAAAIEGDGDVLNSANGRLLIVSDLLEHSPGASAYNGTFSEATLRRYLKGEVSAWLSRASVEVRMLPRDAYRTEQAAARAAWDHYFRAAGVNGGSGARIIVFR